MEVIISTRGAKGEEDREKKVRRKVAGCYKLNFQKRTLDILPMQKEVRRHCADWYLLSGGKHNRQNELFKFTWVRRMKTF